MNPVLKWGLRAGAGLVGVAVLLVGGVFVASEAVVNRKYEKRPVEASLRQVRADAAVVAEGKRLASIYGCNGCHAPNMQGQMFVDEPSVMRLAAPNLTRAAARYSDEDLARLLQHGVRPNGTGVFVMPSASGSHLNAADVAAIIAFLRTQPPAGPEQPPIALGPLGRVGVISGKLKAQPELIPTALPVDLGPVHAKGRYLATAVCADCHGRELEGGEDPGYGVTPDLAITAQYDRTAFGRFMKTGIAPDGKARGFMTEMSKTHFVHYTEAELDALYGYLKARAEKQGG